MGGSTINVEVVNVELGVDSVFKFCNGLDNINRRHVIANGESRDQIAQRFLLLTPPTHHDIIAFIVVTGDTLVLRARILEHL